MSEQNPYGKNGADPYDRTQTGYGCPQQVSYARSLSA
jgi:hypothetical protein